MSSATKKDVHGSVMVVGSGIAGMQAALDLADSGFYVYLVEKSSAIGGVMAQLDKTFPTNDCAMWVISPKLVEVGRHLNIELKTLSEVEKIEGEAGDFRVSLVEHPRYVDMEKCIACGECAKKCPKKVTDDYNAGLAKRKAIFVEYSQAVPLKYCIDAENCIYLNKNGKCGACQKLCPADAIDFTQTETRSTLAVGAVVVAPGFTAFDPSRFDNYQYANFANVITSMEMERVLSATGPFQGHLVRPSDKADPKKIAWLQCVGSRDINRCDHGYCSSVCCMYAVKEAVIAKEHAPEGLDTAIFYMDMRTYGKDFERYYNRAKDEMGVRFVRARVHTIEEDPETKEVIFNYADDKGAMQTERFDMAVLSVGMEVSKELVELAGRIGIELDDDNFVKSSAFSPVATSREGIYVCGAIQEPKDIPYSVMEASAAACEAEVTLCKARGSLTREKEYPTEVDADMGTPRIGVFVCHCGVNIAGVVDVKSVAEMARELPDVVYVEDNLFTCSQDTQDKIREIIHKEKLNRVVVAACTPRTHEELFQETLKDAGLNKYLFEMANIRNQCSWVHSKEKEAATEKAADLLRMAVARARRIRPLTQATISVNNSALVVGGGIAGMTAALGLAEQGFSTAIIEREGELGGNARHLMNTWDGEMVGEKLAAMVAAVKANDLIDIHTGSTIKETAGFMGNFESVLSDGEKETALKHGAVVVATGAREMTPSEYLYGQDERVMTHLDLDNAVAAGEPRLAEAGSVVFIQCVGSREAKRPYCSKVCCTHAIKSALRFKKEKPEMNVYILYRDVRTYGQREELYRRARAAGIVFIRYAENAKPVVTADKEGISVAVQDHILDRPLAISTDLLVLAAAIIPADNDTLSQLFKLSQNEDGFFAEAHAKLRPVEFATAGVFLAGLAHYPKPIEESIAQAKAAASRAAVALSRSSLTVDGIVSSVTPDLCRACGECERACPYNAIAVVATDDGVSRAVVQEALCKGCGACAVACPTGAASIRNYMDEDVLTMVETAMS